MAEPLYQIRDLRLSLPDLGRKPVFGAAPRIEILKGLSFEIARGEVLGIVGGSGSGRGREEGAAEEGGGGGRGRQGRREAGDEGGETGLGYRAQDLRPARSPGEAMRGRSGAGCMMGVTRSPSPDGAVIYARAAACSKFTIPSRDCCTSST